MIPYQIICHQMFLRLPFRCRDAPVERLKKTGLPHRSHNNSKDQSGNWLKTKNPAFLEHSKQGQSKKCYRTSSHCFRTSLKIWPVQNLISRTFPELRANIETSDYSVKRCLRSYSWPSCWLLHRESATSAHISGIGDSVFYSTGRPEFPAECKIDIHTT